ncbi:chloride channel protein [Cesiribacter andamanensis]|uniref:Voltage-gated ClC-type chloride channel ClcB n=1 Tax=Cesiribacter andamanensis AMV16 TaxID=1279009 RepID=M7N6Q3_9BACT|nr:chloride channel protein [Cesiribacter andamanensis]EMR02911.1 Voltage-gated ClC-type chloride channel ClcB [Cesiribacter andamanensis AMV16]
MSVNTLLARFLVWRIRHINNKNFVLLLSGLIGMLSGLAAVTLKSAVHFIQQQLTGFFHFGFPNLLYITYPLIGILLTVLLARYVLKEKLGHGVTDILYTISKKSSLIRRTKMYSRMFTSALTVGFGGSVGLEGPIVVTGSAIGSNVGQLMHLNYKKRTSLIGCGAAGAIAAIFNSPIAGVIFAVEVILSDVTIASFIPLLIASVSGQLVALVLLGEEVLFSFRLEDPFQAADTPYFLLLGAVCGLAAFYFNRIMWAVEGWVGRIQEALPRALMGGIGLGLIIFIFPPIYGEGYDSIIAMLSGQDEVLLSRSFFFGELDSVYVVLLFMLGVLLIKPVASALTIGAGGSGGVFAPSLFMGAVTGFVFARFINFVQVAGQVSVANFALVGMCGLMSGILHAPLTAIFLIAEITGGYTLFVPLMLVSAISYSVSSYFQRYSFYTKNLVERGDFIPYDKDKQVLRLISLEKIVETDFLEISPRASVQDLVGLVQLSKRNLFPVVDEKGVLKGIITLDDIREIMFDSDKRQTVIIETIMRQPPAYVQLDDEMESVMNKFEKTGAWNLPVLYGGRYAGFVSKSRIFNAYRTRLIRQQRE